MLPATFSLIRATATLRLSRLLLAYFLGLDNYRDADAERFADLAVPAVRGAQRALAVAVSAHQAQEASRQLRRPVPPPTVPDAAAVDLRGAEPREVYRRPFTAVYTTLARGDDMTTAVERGAQRLASVAEGDMQATYAHASRHVVSELQARYWRRTLMGDESCALCVLASTMKYKRGDLNPIHPACDCEVVAVYDEANDPMQDEAGVIEAAHAAARELTGTSDRGGRKIDYRKIRTRITAQHGELGTVLVNPRHHFTDEDEAESA